MTPSQEHRLQTLEDAMDRLHRSLYVPGVRVQTVPVHNPATDWTKEAIRGRKFPAQGTIQSCHDSHGLCFGVKHDDGTVASYEARELEIVSTTTSEKDRPC